jgi:hypothetical protein
MFVQYGDELNPATSSPVLRLLADRIALDWLYLHLLDLLCNQAERHPAGAAVALQNRRVAAHRMYRSSLRLYEVFRDSLEPRPTVKLQIP